MQYIRNSDGEVIGYSGCCLDVFECGKRTAHSMQRSGNMSWLRPVVGPYNPFYIPKRAAWWRSN